MLYALMVEGERQRGNTGQAEFMLMSSVTGKSAPTVSKNVSKGIGRVLGWVVAVLSLTQS